MSDLHGVGLVAVREIREALRRKAYWAVFVVLLAGSAAGMVLPELLDDDGPTRYDVGVVGTSPDLDASIERSVAAIDAEVRLRPVDDPTSVRAAVEDGDLDLVVVAGPPVQLVVRASEHDRLVGAVQQAVAVDSLAGRLHDAGLDRAEVTDALSSPVAGVVEVDQDDADRRAASSIVSLVLYLLLFMLMVQVANGVAIEKSNRISEVLLAILRPPALLLGKVLGVAAVGLLTLSAGIVPVVVKLATGGDLPDGLGPAVAAAAAWSVLGLLLYLTLAGALGALVERQEESGSAISPLMVVLVATYLVVQSSADSTLGTVLAYVPLTSPIVEPSRLAMGVSSPLEVAGSLALGLAAVVLAARLAGVIYARAVVRTGRRLKLREVVAG